MNAATTATVAAGPSGALDDFDPAVRRRALERAIGEAVRTAPGAAVNLHCHTFFSYNAYGYSPTEIRLAGPQGGAGGGRNVDFDVLDASGRVPRGVPAARPEGRASAWRRACSCRSSPTRVINSPGEPGISYHMGVGFTQRRRAPVPRRDAHGRRRQRTRDMMASGSTRTLRPVELDYERDVLPLTPEGNATERHVCVAYDRKARVGPAGAGAPRGVLAREARARPRPRAASCRT